MSSTPTHLVVGAVAAALPDVALIAVVGRDWLPDNHPAIRIHRWLHTSPWSLALAAALGWASHLILDRYTLHNTQHGRTRRGWKW